MKKFLLGLVCCLLVVGVANMGHAFWIFGSSSSSGGGGNGGHGARPSQVQGAHYDFGFMQHLQNVPERPTKGGDGPVLGQIDSDWVRHILDREDGFKGECGPDQTVPEPATMILLGIGLIGLAGYGRKKFNK